MGLRWSGGVALPRAEAPGRVWGVVLAWGDLQPTQEEIAWERADRLLEAVDQAGWEVVPVLAPRHPSSPRTEYASEYAKALADPARPRVRDWLPPDLDAWTAFVRAVVGRYGPPSRTAAGSRADAPPRLERPVRAWQLAEVYPRGWAGSEEELVRFLQATAAAVREADPSALVILPAIESDDVALFAFADRVLSGAECRVGRGRFLRAAIEKNLRVLAERDRLARVLAGAKGSFDAVDVHLVVRHEYLGPCIAWVRGLLDRFGVSARIVSSRGGPAIDAGEEGDPLALRRRVVLHAATVLASGASEVAWDWDPPPAVEREALRAIALSENRDAAQDWGRAASLLSGQGAPVAVEGGTGFRFVRGGSWIGVAWADEPAEVFWPGEGEVRLRASDGAELGSVRARDGAWTFRVDRLPVFLLPR